MKSVVAGVKFTAFILLTFGIYSLWIFSFFLSGKSKRRLREFIFYNWARGFVWLANAKLKIIGEPPAPPFLLVSNHVSYFDIAAIRSVAKCVFVAKADIEGWFIAGAMVGSMGQIFINRENRRDIPRAGAKIVEALERGEGVVIFVEGTTSDGKQILPFKSSFLEFAAAKDLSVNYASVSYRTPAGEPPASEAVCWWREESGFGDHLFEFFKLSAFEGTITFGAEPIHSTNRKELAAKLQNAVNEQFIPVN